MELKFTDKQIKIILIAVAAFVALVTFIPLIMFLSGDNNTGEEETVKTESENVFYTAKIPTENAHEEMRGLWIATVNNINFPSQTGLSKKALAAELDKIVEFAYDNGFNAILFQVRPSADALYKSEIFPASKFVSGKCGKEADGGFDCLAYLVDEAHENGIAVHAWVNPLRVTTGSTAYPQTDINSLPSDSPAVKYSECVVPYADGKLYFDAGYPEVRELVIDGVREICENYDVDGIVFDDYFYPYPASDAEFDDSASYALYGEGKSIGDYRRDNVNKLVEGCYSAIKEADGKIVFGISPFGIWQNNNGSNGGSDTLGLEAYNSVYCDALAFAKGGYVDYIAPQLYWSFDTAAAPFGTLAEWWSSVLDGSGVELYIGHGVYRYDEGAMESGELLRQIEFSRELYSYGGGLYYGYAALYANSGGVTNEVNEAFAADSAVAVCKGEKLTLDSHKDGQTVSAPKITVTGMSNPDYMLSVNGLTPVRKKNGGYEVDITLKKGDNKITVLNGKERIEITITY